MLVFYRGKPPAHALVSSDHEDTLRLVIGARQELFLTWTNYFCLWYNTGMDQTQKIAILERQVKVLSTFVHAMMSQSPVQADEFLLQMEKAIEICYCGDPACTY